MQPTFAARTVIDTGSHALLVLLGLVLAFSPLMPSAVGIGIAEHDKQRVAQILFLTLAGLFVSAAIGSDKQFFPRPRAWIARCVALFFLLGLFSSLQAYSPRHAFHEWASLLMLVATAGIVAASIYRQGAGLVDRILVLCGASCLLYVLHVVLIYVAAVATSLTPTPGSFIPGYDNYRFFNHTQTVSLPLLILLTALRARKSSVYWLWFTVTSVWWALLFVTAARGSIIGISAGLAVVLATRGNLSRRWVSELLLTCVAGGLLYCLFFFAIPSFLGLGHWGYMGNVVERSVADPTSSRWGIWRLALDMLAANPFLGAGPGHFAHAAPAVDNGAHPHSWVLQIAAEWGAIALALLCGALLIASQALLRSARVIDGSDARNQAMLSAWLAAGTAILVDGLVSGLIVMPLSQLWIALYVGLAWGWHATLHANGRAGGARGGSICMGAVAALLACLVLVLYWRGLFPEILDLRAHEARTFTQDLYRNGVLRPRIWTAGYF